MNTTPAIAKWSLVSKELIDDLYRRAIRMTGSESDAWDLVQDALERGMRRWPEAPPSGEVVRWLCVVLRNRHLDKVRSSDWRAARQTEPELIDTLPAPESPELPMWRTVDPTVIQRALERLAPPLRTVLLMQSRDNLSLREIAAALHVRPSTAGTRAHRARNKLRSLVLEGAA